MPLSYFWSYPVGTRCHVFVLVPIAKYLSISNLVHLPPQYRQKRI